MYKACSAKRVNSKTHDRELLFNTYLTQRIGTAKQIGNVRKDLLCFWLILLILETLKQKRILITKR